MYPHERSLVTRLEGKPFVLLGVNSDSDREKLQEVLKKEKISWRSFWDAGKIGGPIATRWNVEMWPTVYLLDHRGIIRAKQLQGTALDKKVDQLLQEASSH
jgi:hypothetical protein